MLSSTGRVLAATALTLGAVLFTVAEFISPDSSGSPAQMLATMGGHRAGMSASLLVSLSAAFLLLAGLFLLGRAAVARGRGLISTAIAVIVWAMLADAMLFGVDVVFLSMTDPSLDAGQMAQVIGVVTTTPSVLAVVLLTGHYVLVAGFVLLGIGLWRAHLGPRWAAVFIAICGLVDAVGDVFGPVGGVVAGAASDVMLIAGFAAVGWYLVRGGRPAPVAAGVHESAVRAA